MIILDTLAPGARFIYGGVDWIVLEHLGDSKDITLCLTADIAEIRPFDTDNHDDFRISSLRTYLNEAYLNSLVASGADRNAFLHHNLDLTSDDGLKDYGIDDVQIGLLSYGQYRKYHDLFPVVWRWWWTCTPDTVFNAHIARYIGSQTHIVRCISSADSLSSLSAYVGGGVRPTCAIRSNILVSRGNRDGTRRCDLIGTRTSRSCAGAKSFLSN